MSRAAPGDAASGRGLLERLRESPPDGGAVLWWLGQSGFAIRFRDELAAVDPYLSDTLTVKYAATTTPHVRMKDRVIDPGQLAEAPVTALAATHHHTDHLDPGTLGPIVQSLGRAGMAVPLVAPEAWRALAAERAGLAAGDIVGIDDGVTVRVGSFELMGIASAHERIERDDKGHCKYLGYVIRCGSWTVYHSGDTLLYEGLAERLHPFAVDVALLPINGKVGNMSGRDAAQLARDAGVRLVVPCHYDMFTFNTADPAVEFVPECLRLGQPFTVLPLGGSLTLGSAG